jgi:hypothetical protein
MGDIGGDPGRQIGAGSAGTEVLLDVSPRRGCHASREKPKYQSLVEAAVHDGEIKVDRRLVS